MRTKYDSYCDFCGRKVKAGCGWFQTIGSLPPKIKQFYVGKYYTGKWLCRCTKCKDVGNETLKYKKLCQP